MSKIPWYGSSESNEWFTPQRYLNPVRKLLGTIDLDPASCEEANKNVGALTYYSAEDNGLAHDWPGRVFLNPPYGTEGGKSNQDLWTKKLIAQYTAGITQEAVLLVSAATSERWFVPLWDYPICFTNHRIRFIPGEGQKNKGNSKGSAYIYFGPQVTRFIDVFTPLGTIVGKLSSPLQRCKVCGEPVPVKPNGRLPEYCNNACKQRSYRLRAVEEDRAFAAG